MPKYSKEWLDHMNKGRITIDDVQRINKENGLHFFDKDAMRFFRSHIERDALRFGQLIDDTYFITSEQFVPSSGEPEPRMFTVRTFDKDTGRIYTAGHFNMIPTKKKAKEYAYCLVDHKDDLNSYETCWDLVGL